MANSSTQRGWREDKVNGRLAAQYNGTEVFDFDANDIAFAQNATFAGTMNITGATTLQSCVTISGGCQLSVRSSCGMRLGIAGACGIAGNLRLSSTGVSGCQVRMVAPACADWTLTFPADDGNCGQQLTTDGCGVTSWAAACSVRDHKQCINPACKEHAYNAVKSATVYDFAYKPGYGIKSSRGFTGIMADEAPWAMQGGNGDIFSPINAFGHLMAAVQVIDEKLDNVSARVEALEAA